MHYITVSDLRDKSDEVFQRVDAGEEFVVTRHGNPIGLLVGTAPDLVEDSLRALRLVRFGELVHRIQAESLANGTDRLTEEDIQAEIDAARAEARAASSG